MEIFHWQILPDRRKGFPRFRSSVIFLGCLVVCLRLKCSAPLSVAPPLSEPSEPDLHGGQTPCPSWTNWWSADLVLSSAKIVWILQSRRSSDVSHLWAEPKTKTECGFSSSLSTTFNPSSLPLTCTSCQELNCGICRHCWVFFSRWYKGKRWRGGSGIQIFEGQYMNQLHTQIWCHFHSELTC